MSKFEEWYKSWEDCQPNGRLSHDCYQGAVEAWDYQQERISALEEAITPSTETKRAYWGDDNLIGDWQAIKDIMDAIRKRAAGYLGEGNE